MKLDLEHPGNRVVPILKAAPELLRSVLDGVIAFVGILTPDGILAEANELAIRATGLARDKDIGRPFWECHWWNFDPAVQERVRDAIRRAAAGEQIRYEAEIQNASNALIVIDFLLTPHRDADGLVDFLIPSGVDITDRVRHQEALRASHDSFQRLVTNSPFGIFAVDADFRLSMVSIGAQKVFRNVQRPLNGRDMAEALRVIWPEPFATEAIGHFRNVLATGVPYHAASSVQRRHDTSDMESYDWKIERVVLPDGRQGAVCNFYDLSESEVLMTALRAEEARFRGTFDNAAVGIAHVAPDGRWLLVNRKLCSIVGYSESELLAMKVQKLTQVSDIAPIVALLRKMLAGEINEYEVESRFAAKSGVKVWINLTVSCIRDSAGKVEYFIVVIEDISEKRAAEKHQKLLIAELDHRVKNILATVQAMASHTMRTAGTMGTFQEKFTGRLRAIAASHDSVFQKGQMRADLAEVILKQLSPYAAADNDRLHLSGPTLHLGAACAHALGLITHEMATNASKYGALASDSGQITVSWQPFMQGHKCFARLIWQEHGGPEVVPPARTGFGSRLITSTLEHSLQGTSRSEYLPDGLRAEFTFETEDSEDA
ncbi:MAG: PAS domain S-box protein [Paracoccaceae bacterium]